MSQDDHQQLTASPKPVILVNASRVGSKGGLLAFTLSLLECLSREKYRVEAVLPDKIYISEQIHTLTTPHWLAGSTNVSQLRPILWLLYSTFFFPRRRNCRTLCTTHHVLPFRKNQVVTVHDLRPLYEPDSYVQYLYFRYLLPRALRRCAGILTVSQTSKIELTRVYGIPSERVFVVPNAIKLPSVDTGRLENRSQVSQPFLLVVGASWKHKNAIELIENYRFWSHRYSLKLVAGRGQYLAELKRKVSELNLADRVDFISSINDERLAVLYSTCAALVYPSRMEGFGIPPLEAMSHGKPTIVSDIPVTRELLGDVPLYVKLGDPESWGRAFDELVGMESDQNHWRRSGGRLVAARYTLEHTQQALSHALREIWGL